MKYKKSWAFVLHKLSQNERYLDVVMLTESFGKLRVKVKLSKKMGTSLAPKVEPVVLADVELYTVAEHAYVLTNIVGAAHYSPLNLSFEKLGVLFYMTELVMELLPYEETNEPVFMLFKEACALLVETKREQELACIFTIHLLSQLGFFHMEKKCPACGEAFVENEEVAMPDQETEITHRKCAGHVFSPVSFQALKTLLFWQQIGLEDGVKLALSEELLQELEAIIGKYVYSIVGKPLKSTEMFGK